MYINIYKIKIQSPELFYLQDPPALWVLPSGIPLFGNCNNKASQNLIYTPSRDTWTAIADGEKTKIFQGKSPSVTP